MTAKVPRFADRLEAWGAAFLFGGFKLLPLDCASALGGALARRIGPFLGVSKHARRNFSRAFPESPRPRSRASSPACGTISAASRPKEDIVEFLERVYASWRDILTRADLRRLDHTAEEGVRNWLKGGKQLPHGLVPTEFELNTAKRVAKLQHDLAAPTYLRLR
jgi:hypothetical protein